MDSSMKCKQFFNHFICKVKSSPQIFSIPNTQVPLDVITSSSCGVCNTAVNNVLNSVVKPLKGIFKVNLIDIDKTSRNISSFDLVLPSFHIGKAQLGSRPTGEDFLQATQKYLKALK